MKELNDRQIAVLTLILAMREEEDVTIPEKPKSVIESLVDPLFYLVNRNLGDE